MSNMIIPARDYPKATWFIERYYRKSEKWRRVELNSQYPERAVFGFDDPMSAIGVLARWKQARVGLMSWVMPVMRVRNRFTNQVVVLP